MMKHQDIVIEPPKDVEEVINTLNRFARSGEYVFRGYGKQSEILPNIIRGKTSYVDVESELLHNFEKYGSNYFNANTPIDFMSYAQHFGLPTRLLDFTYNPFIALSFALYTDKGNGDYKEIEDKTYYYVRFASLKENLCIPYIPLNDKLYHMELTRTESLATKACQCIGSVTDLFGENALGRNVQSLGIEGTIEEKQNEQKKLKDKVILFIAPNQSNQRLIMQQGLFMFPYTLDKTEHLKILKNNSAVIKIHKDFRSDLNQYLDTLGYNTFRLMPDLSSICGAVKRRIIDERKNKSTNFKKKGGK